MRKFIREFIYQPGGRFTVTDEVETAAPALLTVLLHADDRIERAGDGFVIDAGGVKLSIHSTIDSTNGQRSQPFQSAIEPNIVTSPGPPGAVDKGERQARGQKLVLTTPAPVTRARFVTRLQVQR